MSILDKRNYVEHENWYRLDDQIAWYDRRIQAWTTYMIDDKGNQISDAEYYANKSALKHAEEHGTFRIEETWDD